MNGILETGISLILVFLIFSIIAYIIQELISVNLKFRGNMLWKSMAQLFDGYGFTGWRRLCGKLNEGNPPLTRLFYDHPQIQSLMKEKNRQPSYIPAANFALAIMDLVAKEAPADAEGDLFVKVKAGLTTFKTTNGNIGKIIEDLVNTSINIQDLQRKIEGWFNSYMQRVTGWYESHILVSLRIIAVALAIGFNLNVIKLSKAIYTNAELRASMVAVAGNLVDHPEIVNGYLDSAFAKRKKNADAYFSSQVSGADSSNTARIQENNRKWADSIAGIAADYTRQSRRQIDTLLRTLSSTGLPIGWSKAVFKADLCGEDTCDTVWKWLFALLGWLITAGCISMGAPFWFDMLMRLVNIRRAGTKPGERPAR